MIRGRPRLPSCKLCPHREQDIYRTQPSGCDVVRGRRSVDEAYRQCMLSWNARGPQPHRLRHNRHTRDSNRALQDRHPLGDHRIHRILIRNILSWHVPDTQDLVDSHGNLVSSRSCLILFGCYHAGRMASLIGENLGRGLGPSAFPL
jgi:hypothetical protein